MKQNATVLDKKGNEIIVGCDKNLCEGCHASMFCTNKNNSFEVLNPKGLDVKKGEKVEIDMPSKRTLNAVFLSLGLPLILFIPGYFVGKLFTQNELILLLWGVGFMALGFLFSTLFFRKKKKEYSPTISKVIEEKEED